MAQRSTATKKPLAPRKRWHYIVTIAWTDQSGTDRTAIDTGTCGPPPGYTREDMQGILYDRVVKDARAQEAVIVFFSLDPDELS